jgi:hypothetical protein
MNFTIRLKKIKSIDKIEKAWTIEDYINLLELFDYTDAKSIPETDLFDMLAMAMSDFEPEEAAEIVLKYKLGDRLKSGQIKSISQEMLEDKIAEEYPDIAFHYSLFNINQLLHDCYNGKFPRTLASDIEIELIFKGEINVTKEIIIRSLSDLLSGKSLLKRLFNEQLDSNKELKDAASIIWELNLIGENTYRIITSDYWLNRDDIEIEEFSGVLREEEINHSKN